MAQSDQKTCARERVERVSGGWRGEGGREGDGAHGVALFDARPAVGEDIVADSLPHVLRNTTHVAQLARSVSDMLRGAHQRAERSGPRVQAQALLEDGRRRSQVLERLKVDRAERVDLVAERGDVLGLAQEVEEGPREGLRRRVAAARGETASVGLSSLTGRGR